MEILEMNYIALGEKLSRNGLISRLDRAEERMSFQEGRTQVTRKQYRETHTRKT